MGVDGGSRNGTEAVPYRGNVSFVGQDSHVWPVGEITTSENRAGEVDIAPLE
jgi:hypothetical protein